MGLIKKDFYYKYDLDATTFKYGRLKDVVQGFGAIQTTGSSTTVDCLTGVTTGSKYAPFKSSAVGDVLYVKSDQTVSVRKVASVVSDIQITVDSAITIATATTAWWYKPWVIGATAEDGWCRVGDFKSKTVFIDIPTVSAAGGIDVQIEGRGGGLGVNAITLIAAYNFAAAGTKAIPIFENATEIRVGVKGGSGFAGTDEITIYLMGDPSK